LDSGEQRLEPGPDVGPLALVSPDPLEEILVGSLDRGESRLERLAVGGDVAYLERLAVHSPAGQTDDPSSACRKSVSSETLCRWGARGDGRDPPPGQPARTQAPPA